MVLRIGQYVVNQLVVLRRKRTVQFLHTQFGVLFKVGDSLFAFPQPWAELADLLHRFVVEISHKAVAVDGTFRHQFDKVEHLVWRSHKHSPALVSSGGTRTFDDLAGEPAPQKDGHDDRQIERHHEAPGE